MKLIGKYKKTIAGVALASLFIGSSASAAYTLLAGPKGDGTSVTPNGWHLTPAGKQVNLGSFPIGGALSPDGKHLVVSNAGAGTQSLQVIDTATKTVVQTIPYEWPEALYFGVAFSPDGKKMYASAGGNNKVRVFDFNSGKLTEKDPILMKDDKNSEFYPAGISVAPDGKSLYVANNVHHSVSKVNLENNQITATAPVGKRPYAAELSKDGSTLYVSNWGESSVTALNTKDMSVKKTIPVGLHPNAITVNPVNGTIYAANSDSDDISIIDAKQLKATNKVSLAPYKGAPTGSQPDSLTVSKDGKTLLAANAGNNDVAVIDVAQQDQARVKGLIPTGWYPTGVYLGKDDKEIYAINAKGLGAGPNDKSKQWLGNMINGSLSILNVPDEEQLKKYSDQTNKNNNVSQASKNSWWDMNKDNSEAFPIPRYPGQGKSPIKHVIYVIKENQTYDQVFGDAENTNGDPSLAIYGKDVTPNHHKLAKQFVTLDNFYADAEVSADGHNWTTQGKANDYVQKNWLANYSGKNRDYDFDGGGGGSQLDEAPYTRSKEGYIWDVAMKAGKSFRNYGEFAYRYDPETKTYLPNNPGTTDFGGNYNPNYPSWDLDISDITRYDEWNKEFKQYEQNGNLPNFETVYLPNDHTGGSKWGPQEIVAQNDHALGKLVDTISHSKYWKDTAIFVVEDDAQGGVDHVDAHRSVALAISPYTQLGKVDSTFYDTPAVLRTMELILGLQSMTQNESAAIPMFNSFTSRPNSAPYNFQETKYWTSDGQLKNTGTASTASTSGAPLYPKDMDFSKPDTVDRQRLNRENWKKIKGYYPTVKPENK
ncbi:bifunctional YncE family protein/alkaline phosphatase family protein [Fictibacillus sp. KU28468]|uniref:bifunctional YncE family protein/alkaline phosphatase family protein n=1 Tax=Fictibacillus sp. KU28468 TaxID=2991053 RepID=UPI00223D0567|nr:bifunctional YncE family protein/alkaline phosphatase family protein [Fictibacillus sp. KU28468]UZJ78646.1 beta-propeller fold lactonase family protein [Fictibacillus sp. KU28468]